jgi:hypothetical protein
VSAVFEGGVNLAVVVMKAAKPKRFCPFSFCLGFELNVGVDVALVTGVVVEGIVVDLAAVIDDAVGVVHELVLDVVVEEELCVELCVEETRVVVKKLVIDVENLVVVVVVEADVEGADIEDANVVEIVTFVDVIDVDDIAESICLSRKTKLYHT